MKRHLCLWFPNWPIQSWQASEPAFRNRPLVLFRQQRGRDVVTACCRAARAAGIRPGIPLAEAKNSFGVPLIAAAAPQFLPDDPEGNRRTLQKLAWDCAAFSPLVGIEDLELPSSLLLDISGCDTCFGGEPRLVRQLQESLTRLRFQIRIGVTDTIGAAWGVAHFQPRSQTVWIVPAGSQERALRPLPIEALRLTPKTVGKLHALDIRRISQLLSLPRASLPSRFGKELLLRLDQALGHCDESIVAQRRPEPVCETWKSDLPLHETSALEMIVARLVESVVGQLHRRGEGVLGLHVELRGEAETLHRSLSLLRPTTDDRYMTELLSLWWERQPLPRDITRVQIEVAESGTLTAEQRQFWQSDNTDRQHNAAALIEKLSSRLGPSAVLRPVPQAEQQPELAYGYEPCLESARKGAISQEPEPSVFPFPLSRPLWLKREPVPVEVSCVVPDGPPYRFSRRGEEHAVARCWGPERITTGWWRGSHIKRDYYHVETAAGYRCWLFQDWMQGGWFLHALFD